MSLPTEKEAAEGWMHPHGKTLPPEGVMVEVKGSDFMGDWFTTAKMKVVNVNGPRVKWIGEGWMGTRPRTLGKGDVEMWRYIPKITAPKENKP